MLGKKIAHTKFVSVGFVRVSTVARRTVINLYF